MSAVFRHPPEGSDPKWAPTSPCLMTWITWHDCSSDITHVTQASALTCAGVTGPELVPRSQRSCDLRGMSGSGWALAETADHASCPVEPGEGKTIPCGHYESLSPCKWLQTHMQLRLAMGLGVPKKKLLQYQDVRDPITIWDLMGAYTKMYGAICKTNFSFHLISCCLRKHS
jgi:hypothetical protein